MGRWSARSFRRHLTTALSRACVANGSSDVAASTGEMSLIASFLHARGWHPGAPFGPGVVGTAATLGVVVAGAAIVEAALIPGLLIGGAAILAPRLLPRDVLNGLGDRVSSLGDRLWRAAPSPPRAPPTQKAEAAEDAAGDDEPAAFDTWQAVVKTLTYRAMVTTADFGANYFVIGEFVTAASLSSLSLAAGPIFYFAHEAAWHYYGPITARYGNPQAAVHVRIPGTTTHQANGDTRFASIRVSRAFAKTVTYEGVTGVSEFAVNFLFVRDLAAAAGLTAFSMAIAPVVYYVHEKLWDYYGATKARPGTTAPKLLPMA
jgi:uncharacterized membrane protein